MERLSTGTTIMAAQFDEGVVLGADSRCTIGRWVVNRVADKLTRLTDMIYCCRSGGAADTEIVAEKVSLTLKYYEFRDGKKADVFRAANECRKICYRERDYILAGLIVAGWDAKGGGQVYDIPLGGMMARTNFAIGGSGSPFLYGYVQEQYKPDMGEEKCIEMVKTAVLQGIRFDGYSGGVVDIGVITKDGIKRHQFYNTKSGAPDVYTRCPGF